MLILFWTAVVFSLRDSNTYTVTSSMGGHGCPKESHVTLNEEEITAEAGLCVVIPCSFTPPIIPKSIVWFKCDPKRNKCSDTDIIFHTNQNKIPSKFLGRALLLDPNVNQGNCSILINDLTTLDSGSYQLRVNGLTGRCTFPQRANLSVQDLNQKPTVINRPLTEGEVATLTCTAPGLCSGSPPTFTWMWEGKGENEFNITGNITALKTENLTAITRRYSSTLTFNPSAEHHNRNITCRVTFKDNITTEENVTLKVNYIRKLQITGNTTVKKGGDLNLTCNVENFPQSLVVWTKHSRSGIHLQNDTGSATLIIANVTAEDSGKYVCTAVHLGDTVSISTNVKVTWFSEIQNGSGCILQSELLTCVCITEGFPPPTITWPLLKDHTEYSVINTVSNHTVNNTVTVSLKKHENIRVECYSSHENGEAKANLGVQHDLLEKKAIQSKSFLENVSWLEVSVAFLIGVLLSATISCLVKKCRRKRMKSLEDVDETLKLISQDRPLINNGEVVQTGKKHDQHEAENVAVAAENSALEISSDPKDVQYASIDFSILKKRSTREVAKERQRSTEYAEITIRAKEQRKDSSTAVSKNLKGKEEDSMTKHCKEAK